MNSQQKKKKKRKISSQPPNSIHETTQYTLNASGISNFLTAYLSHRDRCIKSIVFMWMLRHRSFQSIYSFRSIATFLWDVHRFMDSPFIDYLYTHNTMTKYQ